MNRASTEPGAPHLVTGAVNMLAIATTAAAAPTQRLDPLIAEARLLLDAVQTQSNFKRPGK